MRVCTPEESRTQTEIKILHVGPDLISKGGIASVLSGYASSEGLFKSLGCDFYFQSTCGRPGAARLWQFVFTWWRIVIGALLKKNDIVHLHTSIRGSLLRKSVLAATCVFLHQRFVIHIHSGAMARYLERLPAPCRRAIGFIWKRASCLVCLSGDMRQYLTQQCECDSSKCTVIHNGILNPSVSDTSRALPNCSPVILFLGKLIEEKGVRVLLDAAERLKGRGVSYRLLVGGNGDVDSFLGDVRGRGLSDNVTFLGWVAGEQKSKLLGAADVFVLPSRSEGFPVSIVEAMAFGAAIVSTNIPGVIEAVTHEREALLVPPDNASALADALSILISDRALRMQLAAAAKQRFLEHFTIERTADALANAYDRVMQ